MLKFLVIAHIKNGLCFDEKQQQQEGQYSAQIAEK